VIFDLPKSSDNPRSSKKIRKILVLRTSLTFRCAAHFSGTPTIQGGRWPVG
jgi:hypothetical protein